MSAPGFARDPDAVLRSGLRHFLLPLLEIFVRCLGLLLGLTRQIRVARQRFTHPDCGDLSAHLFGHDGGALQRGLAAF